MPNIAMVFDFHLRNKLLQFAVAAGICVSLGVIAEKRASAEIMVVGIDQKFAYDGDGHKLAREPGHDEVLFFDLKDPARPELIGSLPLENSIVGPPTNVAVSPDQRLALIASALRSERIADGTGWKLVPSDEVYVVDLTQHPPKQIKTIKAGAQPSGIAIDGSGKFALVANREGKSISVLSIRDKDVSITDTIPMADSVVSVAITPDGRRALAVKFAAHKVALLSIDFAGKVRYEGRDLPVGLYPWTVTVTPNGERALVTNIGANAASDGNAKTVSVIDLKANPARVIQHVTIGDAPEGIAVSPTGGIAAVTVLQGNYDAPKNAWWRKPTGLVSILRISPTNVEVTDSAEVGVFPEGVGFSADGKFVYVGNFADSSLSVLSLSTDGKVMKQDVIKLPGPAASLRLGSQ